jgi:WD40 repeat protein
VRDVTTAPGKQRTLDLGASVTSVHWIGATALFSLGDGAVFTGAAESATDRIVVHNGAILCACIHPDGKRLVTGGDDGKLIALGEGGALTPLFETRGKWIDHVVASPTSGALVAATGKHAVVIQKDKETHRFEHPSTIGGLALDAKGRRLAVSHYGGVTLRYALADGDPGVALKWIGSHLSVTISPNADYVVTAMQENALHGWRLPERTDLKMDGYPAKTKSLSWDKRGRWLATSGADSAIVWPFVGKLGPQGKAPLQLGPREALVTAVAFHPAEEMLAIGYADGAGTLVRFSDQAVLDLVAAGDGPITAIAWRGDGRALAFGDDAGRGNVIEF